MPLTIPARRNLTQEAFTAFLVGQQENRIREEQRRRQEEAADQGSGALGGAIGSTAGLIAGIALAPATGGLSLLASASLGAGIGGGLGQIAGAAIDPPGANFPGGQSAQIAQGLNQVGQSVLRNMAFEADQGASEDEKALAFRERMVARFGPNAIKTLDTFTKQQLEANPGMTPSDVRQAFLVSEAGSIQQSAQDVISGSQQAKILGKEDANKIQVMKANWADPSQAFQFDGHQRAEVNRLKTDYAAVDREANSQQISAPMAIERRAQLSRQRDELARKGTLKPPPLISMEQLAASGGQMEPGRLYTIGDPKTATEGRIFTGRSVNTVPIRGRGGVEESIAGSGIFERIDDDGKRTFAYQVLSDGRKMGVGKLHRNPDFPELGIMSFDKDGDPKAFKSEDGRGDTAKNILAAAIKLEATGLAKDPISAAKAFVQGAESAAAELQREELLEPLKTTQSGPQVIRALERMNTRFKEAMRVMANPQAFDRDAVEGAANFAVLALRQLAKDVELTDSALDDLADVVEGLKQIIVEANRPDNRLGGGQR